MIRRRAGDAGPLDDVDADSAETEHDDTVARSNMVNAAPTPVVTAHPSRQTVSNGASLRIFARAISGTTV